MLRERLNLMALARAAQGASGQKIAEATSRKQFFAIVFALTGCALAAIWLAVGERTHAEPAAKDAAASAASPAERLTALGADYPKSIRPLLKKYCLDCHSTEQKEGELDLEQHATFADVRRLASAWQKVAEMLDHNEMPPKDADQPSADERKLLRGWVGDFLDAEARANAGDPGHVVLRRLNNAEYTYAIADLTGVALAPAKEFPADGAAGEGFTNTGDALAMSPSLLTKYLDAAKGVASHAVLLPDGIRFSKGATRRDWTNEIVAEIRQLYRHYSDAHGASRVNLQGLVWDTNEGGRLPVDRYLAATLEHRDALAAGGETIADVATKHELSPKYLGLVWNALNGKQPSAVLDSLRARWRTAKPADAPALAAEVARWQQALWKFNSVGHIGKVGGPKSWMEAVDPIAARQELRLKLSGAGDATTVYLATGDAGDGAEGDVVVWDQPRLVAPGRKDLLLRDVRRITDELVDRRRRMIASTVECLAAAADANGSATAITLQDLAAKHKVDADALAVWLDFLGIALEGDVKLDSLFTNRTGNDKYDFINGWGSPETPSVCANSSDQFVRVPGDMKPHGFAMHPSPTLNVAVGWRSPIAGQVKIDATVTHAHPLCGNGVTWSIELRRGRTRQQLASGVAQGAAPVKAGTFDKVTVQRGDVLSVLVGPRDGNHSCDLTAVDLSIVSLADAAQKWDLAADVSPDIKQANPHADRLGNANTWNFYTEPVQGPAAGTTIPAGSLLAKWRDARDAGERQSLAQNIKKLLESGPPSPPQSADAVVYRQLLALGGPLLRLALENDPRQPPAAESAKPAAPSNDHAWGVDPTLFGRHVDGSAIAAGSLCVRAPQSIAVRIPADLAAGSELVASAALDAKSGREGSVQVTLSTTAPDQGSVLRSDAPILVADGTAARKRMEESLATFRELFPAALCYVKIVPVDEVVTLTLYYREDGYLKRLMLDDAQTARLDRLWSELRFVSQDALALVDAFQQLMEFATQDGDPRIFEPLRKPINERAAAFRQALVAAEPAQLEAALQFAGRAYRRPLTASEANELRALYQKLRAQELPHDESVRMVLARVLTSPTFLYKLEQPAAVKPSAAVSDAELASRLSFFLWSSVPDEELRRVAREGRLHDPKVYAEQVDRMLRDARVRRLAVEFACQWLHIYEFDQLDEKSERHFPEFVKLRGAMYEESIQFFTDLFQRNMPVDQILKADYTFLNEDLAKHYAIAGVSGPQWRRVDAVGKYGRGGILAQATTLAKQSGASRTSPILRGNWVSEVLLGEKLPRPPKDVPQLPEEEAGTNLTVRQLVERHTSDAKCAVCHKRIDAYGFSLEAFDAIGRRREKDVAGLAIDTRATAMDGAKFSDFTGLRDYLLTVRRAAFERQFARKLLGYALGRSVQLSDEPLLAEMQKSISAGAGVGSLVQQVARSRQFREIRGAESDELGSTD
jgi:hypothetical protein